MSDFIPKAIIFAGILAISVLLAIFVIFILPWILLWAGFMLLPRPPHPEITSGEFPFRIEYEIDGETFVIEDVFIAEFDGFGRDTAQGVFRRWNGWVASTGESRLLLMVDGTRRIYVTVGTADFYMNDEISPLRRPFIPVLSIMETDVTKRFRYTREELLEQHNITLIDWELSNPIVNSFPETRWWRR